MEKLKDINAKTRSSLGRLRKGDPTSRFSDSMRRIGISLDTRTDGELVHDAVHHGDAVIREQHFLWMRDHGVSRTTSRGSLS